MDSVGRVKERLTWPIIGKPIILDIVQHILHKKK